MSTGLERSVHTRLVQHANSLTVKRETAQWERFLRQSRIWTTGPLGPISSEEISKRQNR